MTKAIQAKRSTSNLPDVPAADAPLFEWAVWCAEVGRLTGAFKVFPCVPGEKRPLNKGWQTEAAWDRKTVETMWRNDPTANVGLAIQPGFVAIDGDLYKPGADAELKRFEAEHGALPDTLEHNTPSGGLHLIYSTAKPLGNGRGTLPKFGDVRGHGGLIVGPGSIFNGKRYTVERLSKPAALPPKIEGMLCEQSSRDRSKPDNAAPYVVVDDPGNVKAFTDWCAGNSVRTLATPNGEVAAPCIENQGGNNTLAATGAMAHDYGLSADVALEIAFDHHNPRCEPPWDDEQYETHFLSGYRSATGQLGCRAPARDYRSAFKAVPRSADAEQRDKFDELVRYFENVLAAVGTRERKAFRFREASSINPVEWAIGGWLLKDGMALLFGESEGYKTYIAITMLLCVATGTRWAARDGFEGYRVDGPRPVVIFAGESYRGVVLRVKAAIIAGGFDPELIAENLIIVPDVYSINSAEGLASMADEIEAVGVKPAIIAVDTYNLSLEGDEDSAIDNKRAIKGLRALAARYGGAALATDHVGLGDKKRPRGSSAKKGNSDTWILCERDANMVTLTQEKNREDDKENYRVAFIRSKPIDLGIDPETGERMTNVAFSAIEPPARASTREEDHAKDFTLRAVADAVLEVLRANPLKDWSDRKLAPAVARHNPNIGGEHKIKKLLPALRGEKSSPVLHCYDLMKARWRYNEVDTDGGSGYG